MKILQLAAEASPLAKVGGLADVIGELPLALHRLGVDVRVMLPLHPGIDRTRFPLEELGSFDVARGEQRLKADLFCIVIEKVPYYLLDGDPVRAGDGVYNSAEIDAEKYVFTSAAALQAAVFLNWQPDLLHAHDWHASPGLMMMHALRERNPFWEGTRSLLSLHNLPYLGPDCREVFSAYGIPTQQGWPIPDWASGLSLPQAMAVADWLSTVSPTYAREILSAEYASGLDDLIHSRADEITGILNALDFHHWDPATDALVPVPFDAEDISPRAENKRLLQEEMGLPVSDVPLLVMVTRVDYQKGIDLALGGLERLLDREWQLILLGIGAPDLEKMAKDFGDTHPDRVRIVQSFQPTLSNRMYAGADIILMPSRYEPCGLSQLIGMRYGTVPVARATGGLKDTIVDDPTGKESTGFLFTRADADSCAGGIRRALALYSDREAWRALQKRAMQHTFSWSNAAYNYLELYERLLARGGDADAS